MTQIKPDQTGVSQSGPKTGGNDGDAVCKNMACAVSGDSRQCAGLGEKTRFDIPDAPNLKRHNKLSLQIAAALQAAFTGREVVLRADLLASVATPARVPLGAQVRLSTQFEVKSGPYGPVETEQSVTLSQGGKVLPAIRKKNAKPGAAAGI